MEEWRRVQFKLHLKERSIRYLSWKFLTLNFNVVINISFSFFYKNIESPKLTPYPNWETNCINTPDGIVSIFRVKVDACDRLWGVDTGTDDILGNSTQVRPVRIFVIDLITDKVV